MGGSPHSWVVLHIHGWFLTFMDGSRHSWVVLGIHGWFLAFMDGSRHSWVVLGIHGWFLAFMDGSWHSWMVLGIHIYSLERKHYYVVLECHECNILLTSYILMVKNKFTAVMASLFIYTRYGCISVPVGVLRPSFPPAILQKPSEHHQCR